MSSSLEVLHLQHKGITRSKDNDGKTVTLIYVGSEALCRQRMDELVIGQVYDFRNEFIGALESMEITQVEGPIYNIKEVFKISSHGGTAPDLAKGTAVGPETTTLTTDTKTMPIEQLPNYKKVWNNDLYQSEGWTGFNKDDPDGWWWYATYDNPYLNCPPSLLSSFMWANDRSDTFTDNGVEYHLVVPRTKPGVNFKEVPTYTITQRSRHTKKESSKWASDCRVGKIAQPTKDFGIVAAKGGNFLCRGADIQFDGKYWIATVQYTWSGDSKGWDPDLYS